MEHNLKKPMIFALFLILSFFNRQSDALDQNIVNAISRAMSYTDLKCFVTKEGQTSYISQVWFGLNVSFIDRCLRQFPHQKNGKFKLKNFYLAKVQTSGRTILFFIGGKVRFKPNRIMQSTGEFIIKTILTFYPERKEMLFTVDNRFEKLKGVLNINFTDLANFILKMIKTGEKEKRVNAKDWVKKMNALELNFYCFHLHEGYLYLVGAPKKNLRPIEIIEKAISQLKLGNIPNFMRLYWNKAFD